MDNIKIGSINMLKNKISPQKKATIISSSVAAILTLIKLALGIISGSVAVLASASAALSCAQTGRLLANMNAAAQLAHETTNFWYLERDLTGAKIGIINMIINHSQASCLRNYLTPTHGDASFSVAPAKYMKN